jgi:hypothetical protein
MAALDAGVPLSRRPDRRPARRPAHDHHLRPAVTELRPPRRLRRRRLRRRGLTRAARSPQAAPPGCGSRPADRAFGAVAPRASGARTGDRARSREVAALERVLPRLTAQPASGQVARTASPDTRLLGAVRYASATSTSPNRDANGATP